MVVFRAQVAAFNAHDVEGFLATYADDAEITSGGGPPLRGRENMREHYSRRLATPLLRCDVISAAAFGCHWIVAHELVGDGMTDAEVVATFEIVDGVIRRAMLMTGSARPSATQESSPGD